MCAGDAYRHAVTRETFGRKLIENQVIRAKFGAMGRRLDAAHALMEQLVHLIETKKEQQGGGQDAWIGGLIANLKVLASQTLEHVNREAQQVLGGSGYARGGRGGRIEQISRDVRVMVVGGGSEEILAELAVNQEMKFAQRSNAPGRRSYR